MRSHPLPLCRRRLALAWTRNALEPGTLSFSSCRIKLGETDRGRTWEAEGPVKAQWQRPSGWPPMPRAARKPGSKGEGHLVILTKFL